MTFSHGAASQTFAPFVVVGVGVRQPLAEPSTKAPSLSQYMILNQYRCSDWKSP
jgi:hypothetical protein